MEMVHLKRRCEICGEPLRKTPRAQRGIKGGSYGEEHEGVDEGLEKGGHILKPL